MVIPPPDTDTLRLMHKHGVTLREREAMIRSVIGSQAMSGIPLPVEVAVTAFATIMREPLVCIGDDDEPQQK